jgi:Domain of unknown function (DUF222)/HNH endonuclease
MSELRSAIEDLRSEELPGLPDARIEEDFAELQRAVELLELERLRRLAEIERRRLFERDGHLSAAAWLTTRFRMGWGTARTDARLARALGSMPATVRAAEAGDLSLSAAKVLVGAHEAEHEAFKAVEDQLVKAARNHSVSDLARVVSWWRQRVERDRDPGGEESIRAQRRLHASVSFQGMVRVDGDLDPETGKSLLTALRAVMDTEARSGRPDDRLPAQRRADALGEICRAWLEMAERPSVAGERPHLTVTVDSKALASEEPGELDHVGVAEGSLTRRLACDAAVLRVVLAAGSQPLDIGRRTPVVPPAIRRAVIVRDRGCAFPGCDRPQSWCDAHHVVHWADGGPTSVANLLLLCRPHHRMVHERGRFTLSLEGDRPVFRRPDGSVLEDRGPP